MGVDPLPKKSKNAIKLNLAQKQSPGPMSEISSDLIGRARTRGRIRVRSRTFLRSEQEVEPEPLLEVRARTIVRGRVRGIDYFVTSDFTHF